MDPAIVKVDDEPMSTWPSPHREKFGNQRLHYLIDEILAIENYHPIPPELSLRSEQKAIAEDACILDLVELRSRCVLPASGHARTAWAAKVLMMAACPS
jgi:hypothetical protein